MDSLSLKPFPKSPFTKALDNFGNCRHAPFELERAPSTLLQS